MNLNDLRYLVAVAEHKSFSKAAARCGIGQPTLSTQIGKLEKELGLALFERDNKRVLLNHNAKKIIEKAKGILSLADEIKAEARELQDPYAGTLRLGAFPTIASNLLPQLSQRIKKTFSNLQLVLIEEKTDNLIDKLIKGDLDCAILAGPINNNRLANRFLFQDNFWLAVPDSHRLAKNKTITSEQLSSERLLLLTEGHCLREQTLRVCHLASAEEESFRATSLNTLLEMVRLGTAVTLVPESAISSQKGIKFIPFSRPAPHRNIHLVWNTVSSKVPLFIEISNLYLKND